MEPNKCIPSVWRCFRSYYYPSTHLRPVNLNKILPRYACQDQRIITTIQRLTADLDVRKVFSEPIDYDEIVISRSILEARGFRILGVDHRVCEHPSLPGWVIKATVRGAPSEQIMLGPMNDHNELSLFGPHEGLLRVSMNRRIQKVAQQLGIELVIPRKYAIPFENHYVIISEKLDVLSSGEAGILLKNKSKEEQRQTAEMFCTLIEKVGYVDAAPRNIKFARNGKFTILDTEPLGLLRTTTDHLKAHSVEKCARIGLYNLKISSNFDDLKEFSKIVDQRYRSRLRDISFQKIALSLLCPLIPSVFLVTSFFNKCLLRRIVTTLIKKDADFLKKNEKLAKANPKKYQRIVKEYQACIQPLRLRYLSRIEGIPFP